MQIDNPHPLLLQRIQESLAQHMHKPKTHHQPRPIGKHQPRQLRIILLAGLPHALVRGRVRLLVLYEIVVESGNVCAACALEAERVFAVGYYADYCARERLQADAVDYGLEVGAVAGDEDCEGDGGRRVGHCGMDEGCYRCLCVVLEEWEGFQRYNEI